MSQMWNALALRVCYFLGYYKELKKENELLKTQLQVLGSTPELYVENCCYYERCGFWFIDGDDADLIAENTGHTLDMTERCELCNRYCCNDCAQHYQWTWIFNEELFEGDYYLCVD